ncbi:MAG: acyl-ACP--UDP-N-acetylglucosamine O-acyltransferase [Candidatus Omnitrophota bacterium]
MSTIHPTALLGKNVSIGHGTTIGPHVILEDGVRIGNDNVIMAGVYICSGTEIGDANEIHMQCVIGHAPQDIAFKNEPTFTKIGSRNRIREFVTIHRGTQPGSSTVIGDDNFIMAQCHVAHNCRIGNKVIMANLASLTGHCVIEDGVFLSGMTGLHQYTRVGRLAILGGLSAINKDIPPFMICAGRPGTIHGINVIGLRRAGFSPAVRQEIKLAYKMIYRSGLNLTNALAKMKTDFKSEEVKYLIAFIENSSRGICAGARDEKDGDETPLDLGED